MIDKVKRDTEINWQKAKNFIPKNGEIIIYDSDVGPKFKIGDGVTKINDLPFKEDSSYVQDDILYMNMEDN